MKSNGWCIAAVVLAILCVVSVVANIVFVRNFEITRKHHAEEVQKNLLFLYNELYLAADSDFVAEPILREIRLLQCYVALEGLSVSLRSLYEHHNGRVEGAGFPMLRPVLENIFRNDEEPRANLCIIAEKIEGLYESIEPNMNTGSLFSAISKTNDEIIDSFLGN